MVDVGLFLSCLDFSGLWVVVGGRLVGCLVCCFGVGFWDFGETWIWCYGGLG